MDRLPLIACLFIASIGLGSSKPTLKEAKQCKEAIGIQTGFLEDRDVKTSTAQKNFTVSDAWCAAQNNDKQFFAVDLGEDFLFTKIATQGKVDDKNRFVKSYELQFSSDNKDWKTYMSDGKQNLDGNKDTFTVKYHKLVPDTVGRYVKIIPKSWNNGICSRMELYGCAVDDLKKDQTKGKAKSPAQGSSIKQTEPDTKSVIPNPVNQPQASVVPDPGKATVDATNSAAAAKISLPDSKDFIPAPKNVVPETAKGALGNDASQVKNVVPSAQNTKEVPKRDSEANWSFSTVAQNPQDTATVDNADLLELSRQLGTPTR